MLKKRDVVQSSPELISILKNVEQLSGDILLRSEQYVQLGCDLRDLPSLSEALSRVVDINNSTVLLTAEVSITYMNVEASDALIKWASELPEGRLPPGLVHVTAEPKTDSNQPNSVCLNSCFQMGRIIRLLRL
jgi:tRNA wybutosine-synthesizing protein 4